MKFASFLIGLFILSFSGYSQSAISYEVNLDNTIHHEVTIAMTLDLGKPGSVTVKMPNSSPGRYAEHQFAKNVYNEHAVDRNGDPLPVTRVTPNAWEVQTADGFVRFEYILYANHADGTYSGVDSKKALLNAPATFVYAEGLGDREVRIIFDLEAHPDWRIATQLQQLNPATFKAPNAYYFYDSPILIGKINSRSWKVGDQTVELAMIHEGTAAELDAYTEWTKKIVDQERAVFGALPKYDQGKYTFLCAYTPWMYGDAMEHRNSTVCTSQGNLAQHAGLLISSLAHEFFHGWNIERIRPKDLEPFDFDRADQSEALWFGEGFTNYYEELIQCRAGIITREAFLKNLEQRLNLVANSPARAFRNPIQMSQNAPFSDAATANDETNYANNYISYYYYGEVLGAGLDLMIRTETKSLSLDNFMKKVWENYGSTETPYTLPDLRSTLAEVANPSLADRFFDSYIYDSQLPDFKSLLVNFGVELLMKNPDGIYWGETVLKNGKVSNAVLIGSPLYDAGVEKGDQIISINGVAIGQIASLAGIQDLKVGETYTIEFEQMGERKTGSFTAKPDPQFELRFVEKPTKKQLENLNEWLAPK